MFVLGSRHFLFFIFAGSEGETRVTGFWDFQDVCELEEVFFT